MSKEDIKTLVTGVTFVFGIFLLAMCYHLFLLPNEFITGGTNGLAIIFNKLSYSVFVHIKNSTFNHKFYLFRIQENITNSIRFIVIPNYGNHY